MESATVSGPGPLPLQHVRLTELERIRQLDADPAARAAAFADACRLNVLYMVMRAGSGHLGTSFSSLDIVSWLHLEELAGDDVYFSSKGHDAPALYAVLAGIGRIEYELIHRLRRLGGLPGHPDVLTIPQVNTNTGSLGMGISKAKGFARAARLRGERRRVFVLTGDGELQEGQFWESLAQAAAEGFGEITAIVDHNKIQSDTWVDAVSPLGELQAKVEAFGWAVARCDGNDTAAVRDALAALTGDERPKLVIADTVKGSGVAFMQLSEDDPLYRFHSGAPSPDDYERARAEIQARLDERLRALGADPVRADVTSGPPRPAPGATQKLIGAYSDAIVAVAEADERVVAMDADLILDTGLIAFSERFPQRFVECGIAEQDMVSQAGALALSGLVPVVHSFACFLSTRPNEQIYNNATEGTKVVYVGSLAGLVPGGPGHSHQSVRDISALGAMPGMALIEPGWESEVGAALEWAVREAPGSAYIRLVSVPWELGFEPPAPAPLSPGRGTVLREGGDGLVIAAGPVMLSQAWKALDAISGELTLVAMPWLRDVDGGWLLGLPGASGAIVVLDNHYTTGGLGDAVLTALAGDGAAARVTKIGVESVPACGSNDEVLAEHRLDAAALAERFGAVLEKNA